MKDWTISKRIIFLASTLCATSLVIALWCLIGMQHILAQGRAVSEKSLPGVTQTSTMNYLPMINMVRLYRLMDSITDDERKAIEEATLEDTRKFREADKIYEATIKTPAERAEYEKLGQIHSKYLELRAKYLSVVATNREEARKILTVSMVAALGDFSTQTLSILKQNSDDGAANGKELVATVRKTSISLIVVSLLGLAVAIGLAGFTIHLTTKRLKQVSGALENGADQVATAAKQVSASSQSLAQGASEQAVSIEETTASLEEMSSMTKRNVENSQNTNDLARQTRSTAERGMGDMQSMSAAMAAIKNSSDDISKIIKTIDEIAFQTNILALNAAVEAARAGDAGMGFAVVADEVRNLAQRSAVAAKETAAKIEGAIGKTTQGVQLSGKVADTLNEIVTKARQMDELASNVASASKEQSTGIAQVHRAVSQMDQVTQNTAATAEECASASEEMSGQAQAMKQSLNDLMTLIGYSHAEVLEAGRPSHRPNLPVPRLNSPARTASRSSRLETVTEHPNN